MMPACPARMTWEENSEHADTMAAQCSRPPRIGGRRVAHGMQLIESILI